MPMSGLEMFSLNGQTALVTGASRGIGEALCVALACAGADIIGVARSRDSLTKVGREVEGAGRRFCALACDVGDVGSIERLFADMGEMELTPEILVNNAGMEQVSPSLDVSESLWDRIVDTNLKGAFFVARGFARSLEQSKKPGSIINLGSLTSAVGVPTATPYTSSKSGVLGMTRALASEWAEMGIRVNAIGPGYFRTALTEQFYKDEDWQKAMLARIPMGRFGRMEDLAGICVFLASAASLYVTGQIFFVDGGYLASI